MNHFRYPNQWREIAIDPQVKTSDGQIYDVLFIGTDKVSPGLPTEPADSLYLQGQVLKIVNTEVKLEGVTTSSQPVMIEELQVLPYGQPVLGLKILQMSEAANKSLLVISSSELVSLPLQRCRLAASCSACLGLQDPYCGWDVVSSSCVSHTTFNSLYASEFLQNVSFGRHRQCVDSQSSL